MDYKIATMKLKIARVRKGLSQNRLGEICGVPQCALSEIESGKRTPRPDTLCKICSVLNIKPEEVVKKGKTVFNFEEANERK